MAGEMLEVSPLRPDTSSIFFLMTLIDAVVLSVFLSILQLFLLPLLPVLPVLMPEPMLDADEAARDRSR
jgi:predicted secreted protein